MMTDCLFCKMVDGRITPSVVYEDSEVLAFNDIQPRAPVHVLIVPKRHIATLNDLGPGDAAAVGKLFLVARAIAKDRGFDRNGYRAVINCNADAGQSVFHLHLHLLAGRAMGWPPFPDAASP
jgi:histidine triad (HIT) family protein